MLKFFSLFVAILLGISGCGRIKTVHDGATTTPPSVPAANCVGLSQNAYGCYGSGTVFNGKKIVNGYWSVYTQSNVKNIGNSVFYDRYERGYSFRNDGSAFVRNQTRGYNYYLEWGADNAGTKLTLSDGRTYTYKGVFLSDSNCFEVTREDSSTAKLCNESPISYDGNNSAGLYGAQATFGNLTGYYLLVPGVWKISPYDSGSGATTVTLDANGTTSTGGEWGLSSDGKVISIDNTRYLVNQYLSPSSDKCIAAFVLASDVITSTRRKLCKQ